MTNSYVIYEDLFDKDLNEEIYNTAISLKSEFGPAGVLNINSNFKEWRKASVIHKGYEKYEELLKETVQSLFTDMCESLPMPEFKIKEFDIQLTAHNDGDYYHGHRDIGHPATNGRTITFIYYFHSIPKKFSGGDLVIMSKRDHHVEPANNSLVVFDSSQLHRVDRVICPSKQFEDSRFTLNGWIIRSDE